MAIRWAGAGYWLNLHRYDGLHNTLYLYLYTPLYTTPYRVVYSQLYSVMYAQCAARPEQSGGVARTRRLPNPFRLPDASSSIPP